MGRKVKGWSIFQRAGDDQFTLAYQASPGDWKQHRIPPSVATEPAAKRYAAAWIAERASARGSMSGKTVAELYPMWIALRESNPRLARSTVSDNASHFNNYILPNLGKLSIEALAVQDVRGLVRALRGDYAANTVRNAIASLSSFYDDARAEGWVVSPENVVRHPGVQKEMPTLDEADPVIWVPLDVAQKLVDCDTVPMHRRIKYLLAFFTGLRDGEICGLHWSHTMLDAAVPTVRVDQAFAYRAADDAYASLAKPKSRDSRRTVPIAKAVLGALRWWQSEGWNIYVGRAPTEADAVFPGPSGRHSRPKSAKLIREDLLAAGLPTSYKGDDVVFHSTRSSFSTWLSEAGVSGESIDRLLGHAGKTTRERHYTGELLAKLLVAVEHIGLRWDCGPSCGSSDGEVKSGPRSDTEITQLGRLSSVVEQRFRKSSAEEVEADEEPPRPDLSAVFDELANRPRGEDGQYLAAAQRYVHKPKPGKAMALAHEKDLFVSRLLDECVEIARGETESHGGARGKAVRERLAALNAFLLIEHGPPVGARPIGGAS